MSQILAALCWCFIVTNAWAQTGGIPPMQIYSGKEIGSDKRIFSIAQDKNGLIYLAITDEYRIIAFDGAHWNDVSVPHRPWSLCTDTRGVVWVALEDRVGYFSADEFGVPVFHAYLDPNQNAGNELFQFSFSMPSGVRFGNANVLLDIDTTGPELISQVRRARQGESFVAYEHEEVISTFEGSNAVYRIVGEERGPLAGNFDQPVNYALPIGPDEYVFVSNNWNSLLVQQDGQWQPFSWEVKRRAIDADFAWVAHLSGNRIGCASVNGFFCCDADGELLYHVDKNAGFNSSRVRCFGEFSDGRIWITLEDGFAILGNDGEQARYPFEDGVAPSIFSIAAVAEDIYVTTTSGVFRLEVDGDGRGGNSTLEKIDAIAHIALTRSENQVLMTGPKGIFELVDGTAKLLWEREISVASNCRDGVFCVDLGGNNYSVVNFNDQEISELARFKLPFPSAGIVYSGERSFWVYGYGFRLACVSFAGGWEAAPDIVELKEERALGHAMVDGEVNVLTDHGFKRPEVVDGAIELHASPKLDCTIELRKQRDISKFIECGEYGLLLCCSRGITLHPRTAGGFASEPTGIWALPTSTAPVVWDADRQRVWTVTGNTLLSLDVSQPTIPLLSDPSIQVTVSDGTQVNATETEEQSGLELDENRDPYRLTTKSSIKFDYAVPAKSAVGVLQLQYRLEGLDDWSEWSTETHKEYARLPGGNYRFEVRAKDFIGRSAESYTDWFHVVTPWHQTSMAYLLYATLACVVVFSLVTLRTRRLERANREMKTLVEERTQAAEALRKSEQRFTAFMDNSPFVAWVKDSRGRYEYFSRRFHDNVTVLDGNSYGVPHHELWPAEVAERHQEMSAQVLNTGCPVSFETNHVAPDGEMKHWFVVKFPFSLDNNEARIGGIAVDMTEQRKAELERDRFFETSSDLMCVFSTSGRLKRVNQAFTEILGFDLENLLLMEYTDLVHPHDLRTTEIALKRLRTGERMVHFENRYRTQDGLYRLIAWTIPASEAGASVFYAAGRDITEQRSLERSLLLAVDNEQRRIAHDLHDGLGQELAGVTMMAESLAKALASKSATETPLAAKIARQLETSLQLTRSLARGLRPVEIDGQGLAAALSQLAEHVSDMYSTCCSFHGDASFNLDDPETSTHLFRIAQEAVTNAAKHGKPNTIEIYLNAGKEVLEMKVVDDGTGITKEKDSREGIGMKSMHYRSNLIGGELLVESVVTGGTSVTCRVGVARS